MRNCLRVGLVFLLACSTDTFTGDDGSSPDAAIEGASPDGNPLPPADAAADALDTSGFASNVVLWFDASDAIVNASSVVTQWPTHNGANLLTTILASTNSNTCGGNGIHQTKSAINGHATVSFCQALLTVKDDTTIRLGTAPFLIEVVMRTGAASGGLFITKAQESGATFPFSSLAFWARDPSNNFDGELSATDNVIAPNSSLSFQYVGFGRFNSTMNLRINGAATISLPVGQADDISSGGNDYQIGGSVFDSNGVYKNIFGGDLAEIIVLRNASLPMAQGVEIYLKAKYAL